jgi:molybdenum cofactor cytidylyltransferase
MLRLSTVILAAGASKRLGYNKLCVRIDGEAVIRKTVRLFMETGTGDITVVTGHERERIEGELIGFPVAFAHNPSPEEGMSSSIRAAMPAVSASDLVLFHLGDKPFVTGSAIKRVLRAFHEGRGSIVVAVHQGTKGHPVLIDMRKHLSSLRVVEGEGGLRNVVTENSQDVCFVEAGEGAILDLDTEDDMSFLRRRGYTIEKD